MSSSTFLIKLKTNQKNLTCFFFNLKKTKDILKVKRIEKKNTHVLLILLPTYSFLFRKVPFLLLI